MHHNFQKSLKNNLWALKLCFQASPVFVIGYTFEIIKQQFMTFLELVFGVNYVLKGIETGKSFAEIAKFLLLMMLILAVTTIITSVLFNYILQREEPTVNKHLMRMIYEKARSLDLESYDNPKYYDELNLAMAETKKLLDRVKETINLCFTSVTAIVSYGIFYLKTDAVSLILVLAASVIVFKVNRHLNKLNYQLRMESNQPERKRGYIHKVFYLSKYAKEIRLNPKAADILTTEFGRANEELYGVTEKYAGKKCFWNFMKNYTGMEFFTNIVYLFYLLYRVVVQKTMLYSSLVVLFNSANNMRKAFGRFADLFPLIMENDLYITRIRTFLDREPLLERPTEETLLPMPEKVESICFEHVSFAYTADAPCVLKDVSFTLERGQRAAIVGFNGAGKTTLVKLLLRFYDPTEGCIKLNGCDIRRYPLAEYRRVLSAVFQDFRVYAFSLKENVLLDRYDTASDEAVQEALDAATLTERCKSMQHGLHQRLSAEFEDGINLSGGESQKLSIARSVFRHAQICIMDEPSSALDPVSEYKMNRLMLKNTTADQITVLISHRLSTTRFADEIFMFREGQMIERGSHDVLIEAGGAYAEMFRTQAEQYILLN